MILLYSGTPGSGKSLHAVDKILEYMKRKKTVIGNFPIDEGYFKGKPHGAFIYRNNQELTVDYLKEYAREHHKRGREGQTLVVIDECAAIFNCRSWDAKNRLEWIYFFQMHRHLGFDFILISQHDRLIDRQIRAFIETEYKHRALKHYKTFGWLLSLITGGMFVAVEYWYGTRLRCGSEYFWYRKRKARIYDSYRIFE